MIVLSVYAVMKIEIVILSLHNGEIYICIGYRYPTDRIIIDSFTRRQRIFGMIHLFRRSDLFDQRLLFAVRMIAQPLRQNLTLIPAKNTAAC